MTSATTPAPYIASSNSTNVTSSVWGGFDGIISSGGNWWHTITGDFSGALNTYNGTGVQKAGITNPGAWLALQFDKARPISKYRYWPRSNVIDGTAKSWNIMYSLDGINYVVVDTKVDQTLTFNVPVTYTFTSVTAKYWGINIYKSNETYCITSELTFYKV
jgi:hypothetical protein